MKLVPFGGRKLAFFIPSSIVSSTFFSISAYHTFFFSLRKKTYENVAIYGFLQAGFAFLLKQIAPGFLRSILVFVGLDEEMYDPVSKLSLP